MGQNWRNPRKKKHGHGNKKKPPHHLQHLVSSPPRYSSSSSSSSSLTAAGKEIYYCVKRGDYINFAWYSSSSMGEYIVPGGVDNNMIVPDCTRNTCIAAAVSVGSTIYVLLQHQDWDTHSLYYFDTSIPEKGWMCGPPTTTYRIDPFVHVYNDKIYVFGGLNPRQSASPYAECFDPSHGERWVPFLGHNSDPPSEIRHLLQWPIESSNTAGGTGSSLFVLTFDWSALYEFSFVTESWRLLDNAFTPLRESPYFCVVGHFIYQCYGFEIYAYDLINHSWLPDPVKGYRLYLGTEDCPEPAKNRFPYVRRPILKHIGNGELLLAWCCFHTDFSMHIVTDIVTFDAVDDKARSKGRLASSPSLVANLMSRKISNNNGCVDLFHCVAL